MASVEFDLKHGLKMGSTMHTRVVLAEPSVADLLECGEASERAVITAQGPALVRSPTVMGMLLLCRQIKSIGGTEVPFTPELLKKLHPEDLMLMQVEANKLDEAAHRAVEALSDRGREGDGGSGD